MTKAEQIFEKHIGLNSELRYLPIKKEDVISALKEALDGWINYDWDKEETHPEKYGKYFIHRKDGKVHWETWNNTGWAYNNNSITHWKEITLPKMRKND